MNPAPAAILATAGSSPLGPQIGLAGAFLGGVLSLLSPCSALLLPSFFAYAFGRLGTLLTRTVVFWIGLAVVLVPLGAGVGAIGSLLTRYRDTATLVGGMVIIVLGVIIILGGGFRIPGVESGMARLRVGSTLSLLALGALYGLAGFCAGPLLGAVLTVAAAGGSAAYGGLLMAVYTIGMAAPLFVLALLWDRLRLGDRSWLRGRPLRIGPIRTHTVSLISGLLFIGIGVLFILTSGTANLGSPIGVDAEYDLQVWLRSITRSVSDVGVLFIVALLLVAAWVVRMLLRARGDRSMGHDVAPGPAISVDDTDPVRR